ncbi:hypothetical protein CEE98_11685, partial [Lactobacillus crispatus]
HIGRGRTVGALHRGEGGREVTRDRGLRQAGRRPVVDVGCRRQMGIAQGQRRFTRRIHRDRRTIVGDGQLGPEVEARVLEIAVLVGDRRRQGHHAGGEADAFPSVRIAGQRLLHSPVFREGHDASVGIDRNGERQ